jgi:hypothetical protein
MVYTYAGYRSSITELHCIQGNTFMNIPERKRFVHLDSFASLTKFLIGRQPGMIIIFRIPFP